MTAKKELQVAYFMAVVLLVVGVLCYAASPAKSIEQPVRVMFKSIAGNVLFDHKTHTVESGYGIACSDCHHHPADDESANRSCGDCHNGGDSERVAQVCAECHEPDDVDPADVIKRGDAFHDQCIGCHQEKEAGPAECSSCHVM